jgi:hypothetical protein
MIEIPEPTLVLFNKYNKLLRKIEASSVYRLKQLIWPYRDGDLKLHDLHFCLNVTFDGQFRQPTNGMFHINDHYHVMEKFDSGVGLGAHEWNHSNVLALEDPCCYLFNYLERYIGHNHMVEMFKNTEHVTSNIQVTEESNWMSDGFILDN